MKKLIILALIFFSTCNFLQFSEENEEEYSFGDLYIEPRYKSSFNTLPTKDKLVSFIKETTKDLKNEEKKFIEKHGETFKNVTSGKIKAKTFTLVNKGLAVEKIEYIFEKKAGGSNFDKETEKKFKKFYTKLHNTLNKGENKVKEEAYLFMEPYKNFNKTKDYSLVITLSFPRNDKRIDNVFITSSREFTIPPIKKLKETSKDKKPEELTDEDYDITYPTEFSKEQNEAILEWYRIAGKKALTFFTE